MCYEHVLDYICINMPTADSTNPYMCETTDYTAYAILIRRTNNCVHSRNVLYILFCAVDFSQQKRAKHGHSLLVRRATPEHSRLHFDNFPHSGTWRRVLLSLPKGPGDGHSLVMHRF